MTKLVIACPDLCSLHPDKIGPGAAAALLAIRENGAGALVFGRRAKEILGHPVPTASVQRHLKHYRPAIDEAEEQVEAGERLGDLAILDLVIQRGAANSKNWRPSIKDTLDAMRLKVQLTGNSAFEDLLSLFDGAEVDEAVSEAEDAIKSADEAAQEAEEDDIPGEIAL